MGRPGPGGPAAGGPVWGPMQYEGGCRARAATRCSTCSVQDAECVCVCGGGAAAGRGWLTSEGGGGGRCRAAWRRAGGRGADEGAVRGWGAARRGRPHGAPSACRMQSVCVCGECVVAVCVVAVCAGKRPGRQHGETPILGPPPSGRHAPTRHSAPRTRTPAPNGCCNLLLTRDGRPSAGQGRTLPARPARAPLAPAVDLVPRPRWAPLQHVAARRGTKRGAPS